MERSSQSVSGQNRAHARYRALDGYRFVAATGVALSHYNMAFDLRLERFSPAIPQLGEFVDFFFILSGFVIGVSYLGRLSSFADYGRFLRARLARLYPLHAATALAFLGFAALSTLLHVPQNHQEMTRLADLPANLAMVHAWGVFDHLTFNGPSWSISAEWFCCLLCPLLFALVVRLPLAVSALGAIAAIAAMIVVRDRAGLGPWTAASYDFGAVRAVPLFFLGILIAVAARRTGSRWSPPWFVAHALFAASLLALHAGLPHEIAIAAYAGVIVCAVLAERAGRPTVLAGPTMATLGDASYAIYLLHFLIAIPVVFALRRFDALGGATAAAAALVALAATVVISAAVYRGFELPLRRMLGPSSGPRPAPARLAPAE